MNSAVIVLTWNGGAEAIACLQRVHQLDPAPDIVLVVDNDSQDGTPDQVAALFPTFLLIRNPRNLGFAGGMNIGIRTLLDQNPPPDVIILLNQDTLVDPGWLGAIIAPFADPVVGAVGCKIRYPDGTIQHAGLTLDWPLALPRHVGRDEPDRGQYDTPRDVNLSPLPLWRSGARHCNGSVCSTRGITRRISRTPISVCACDALAI